MIGGRCCMGGYAHSFHAIVPLCVEMLNKTRDVVRARRLV